MSIVVRERVFTAVIVFRMASFLPLTPSWARCGVTRSYSSSAPSMDRYWPFIHSSFVASNTAGFLRIPSSVNNWIISSSVMISLSPPGLQPRRARKLRSAAGRMQVLVVADRGGAVALGELLPVRAVDHRHVGEDGERRAERLVEGDLLRRVRDVVRAAQHVGDPHVEVVHDHGVVVERGAVGAEDHEVLDVFALEADGAVDRVVPADFARGDAQPDRALVRVRLVLRKRSVGDFLVPLDARALKDRLLVPVEAEPAQAVEDDAGR